MSHPELLVFTYTGSRKNSGTNNNVYIKLYGVDGTISETINLNNIIHDDFEKDKTDTFEIIPENVNSMDRSVVIDHIEIWKSSTLFFFSDDWFVDKIVVENKATNSMFVFPIYRWIKSGKQYHFKEYDTSLPQHEQFLEQRRAELAEKRKSYQFYSKLPPGWPAQVKKLPKEESFSSEDQWDITKLKLQLVFASKIKDFTTEEFDSLDDIEKLYDGDSFAKPQETISNWRSDYHFGHQRINDINPALITLYTDVSEKFPVTDEILGSHLNGLTINEAISQRRLFSCDLKILDGLHHTPGKIHCTPIALLFVDDSDQLRPVAIQLFQEPGDDNPIFTPSDENNLWTLVKMWYNHADCCYHQALTHLGFTHLLIEGIAISTNRNLSGSHPINKLLQPHFLYLIAINTLALDKLVSPGGWVDNTMSYGSKGMLDLTIKGLQEWRMDVHGLLPENLKARGILDEQVLPGFHYRHDAMLLFNAIKKYVTSYVNLYYTSPELLKEDNEIQAWVFDLVKERKKSDGGCGLKGVPGNGQLNTTSELVDILTCIIFTCSVAHASANFGQYDQYAYPPNYPTVMNGKPPNSKDQKVTEKDILGSIVNKKQTLDVMVVTTILSRKSTNSLGDFEVQYVFEPNALEIIKEFRHDLQEINKVIKSRNDQVQRQYDHLVPDAIPNAISI